MAFAAAFITSAACAQYQDDAGDTIAGLVTDGGIVDLGEGADLGVSDNADTSPNLSNVTLDTDGDGVGDNADLFPFNPYEWDDNDADGIGDNRDPLDTEANYGMGTLIKLEGGTHTIGSKQYYDDISSVYPVKQVTISSFYIANTETFGFNWDRLVSWAASRGYDDLGKWESADNYRHLIGDSIDSNHPATMVRWADAVKYCNAASEVNGLRPVYYNGDGSVYRTGYPENGPVIDYSSNGYRLPTEAEWEYAARGGLENALYPWGNFIDTYKANYGNQIGNVETPYGSQYKRYNTLWYNSNNSLGISTSPVRSYTPNGYGLYDMAGNVKEWCNDVYSSVDSEPEKDPTGPEFGSTRVVRGGDYESLYIYLRNYIRYSGSITEGSRWPGYGFRIARSLDSDGDGVSDMMDLSPLNHTNYIQSPSQNQYTDEDISNARIDGQNDVINNPVSFNLYNASSIMEINLGGLMIQENTSGKMEISYSIETSNDLKNWSTHSQPTIELTPQADKEFIRLRIGE